MEQEKLRIEAERLKREKEERQRQWQQEQLAPSMPVKPEQGDNYNSYPKPFYRDDETRKPNNWESQGKSHEEAVQVKLKGEGACSNYAGKLRLLSKKHHS